MRFTERLIYGQLAAQAGPGLQQNRPSAWSRQLLKIEQLIGPSPCSASVLSPRGFRRLRFSLAISALVSCSFTQKPASGSRPLYAGRRLPSHQAPDRLGAAAAASADRAGTVLTPSPLS
jgi:hypothetical protein